MKADEVKPYKWTQDGNYPILPIFESEEYSIIWGKYENEKRLGVRWNGDENNLRGFPGQGAYPTWYIEPDFVAILILEKLLGESTDRVDSQYKYYVRNIHIAIEEISNKK